MGLKFLRADVMAIRYLIEFFFNSASKLLVFWAICEFCGFGDFSMAERACVKRLQKEYRALCKVRCLLFLCYCDRAMQSFCSFAIAPYWDMPTAF